ncbi:TPA: hypothetical protein ACF2DE_002915 [Clostridium perfringens]
MRCKYREKLKNKNMHVCTAFIDWWEKDAPKDRLFLTEPDCMCELYEGLIKEVNSGLFNFDNKKSESGLFD